MKNIFMILLILITMTAIFKAQTFEDFLTELTETPIDNRQTKVDSFLTVVPSFPFTEDTLAHFIYSGAVSEIAVAGDFSGWDPSNAPMFNVGGTNFWYRTENFENHARMDYKFVYNGNIWMLDPRNPHTAPGGFGDNSELQMPAYVSPPEIIYYPGIPHGIIEDTLFYSTNLNNSRQIKVYLPPGYDQTTTDYPVVLMHDGLEYISFSKMNNIIDYLISENLIQPVISVFVPPVDRSAEYIDAKQQTFTNFIIQEVMPWIDHKYRTSSDPALRAVMGSSAGGNISLWLGMNHSEVFGNVGAFSSYIENDIQNYFANSPKLDLRIYMNHGTYDHLLLIHQSVNSFVPVLQTKGYDFHFSEYPEGHSYGFWRAHLDDALIYFFPASATSITRDTFSPDKFNLFQNYPNPFNPNSLIVYSIPEKSFVTLIVYDVLGREVVTLINEEKTQGNHKIEFDGRGSASGTYFYRLQAKNFIETKKMILLK